MICINKRMPNASPVQITEVKAPLLIDAKLAPQHVDAQAQSSQPKQRHLVFEAASGLISIATDLGPFGELFVFIGDLEHLCPGLGIIDAFGHEAHLRAAFAPMVGVVCQETRRGAERLAERHIALLSSRERATGTRAMAKAYGGLRRIGNQKTYVFCRVSDTRQKIAHRKESGRSRGRQASSISPPRERFSPAMAWAASVPDGPTRERFSPSCVAASVASESMWGWG